MKPFKAFISSINESSKADEDVLKAMKKHADNMSDLADKKSNEIDERESDTKTPIDKSAHEEASILHHNAAAAHHDVIRHLMQMRDNETRNIDNLINTPRHKQRLNHKELIEESQAERNSHERDMISHSLDRDIHASNADYHKEKSW